LLQSAASAPLLQLLISTTEPCPATRVEHSSDGVNPSKYDVYLDMVSARLVVTIGPTVNCVVTGDVSRWE